MASTTTESPTIIAIPFRESHWRTKWVFIGLVALLIWRSSTFLDPQWLVDVPVWLLLIATGLVPQLFLLLFPVFTREPRGPIYIPKLSRCLIEVGIAIPVTIAILATLTGVNYLVERSSSGTALTPDAMTRMSQSSPSIYRYSMLAFSFTVAPIAEEVYFRGFLQNAFRHRMPLALAVVAQSATFGVCHFFGAIHSAFAVVLGLFLTLLYEWRRTLITPIAVHAMLNAVFSLGVALMAADYVNSPVLGVNGDSSGTECVIREVVPGSAADKAGIQVGDIVTLFNDQPIRNFPHLRETVRLYQPGDSIPIAITRSGSPIEVNAILERRDTD